MLLIAKYFHSRKHKETDSSVKIEKYENLTSKEVLPSDKSRIIGHTKFNYPSLGKALEKQTKTIEDQGQEQIKANENRVKKTLLDTDQKSVTTLFQKDFLNEEAIYKLNKIE